MPYSVISTIAFALIMILTEMTRRNNRREHEARNQIVDILRTRIERLENRNLYR